MEAFNLLEPLQIVRVQIPLATDPQGHKSTYLPFSKYETLIKQLNYLYSLFIIRNASVTLVSKFIPVIQFREYVRLHMETTMYPKQKEHTKCVLSTSTNKTSEHGRSCAELDSTR